MGTVKGTKTVCPGPNCIAAVAVFQELLDRFCKMSSGLGTQPGGWLRIVGSNQTCTVASVVVSVTGPPLLELTCNPRPGTASKASPFQSATPVAMGLAPLNGGAPLSTWSTAHGNRTGGLPLLVTDARTTAQLGAMSADGPRYKVTGWGP